MVDDGAYGEGVGAYFERARMRLRFRFRRRMRFFFHFPRICETNKEKDR